MLTGSYSYPAALKVVRYGPGSLAAALSDMLTTLGGTKALVVTGRSLHDKTDVVRKVEQVLKQHNAHGGTFFEIGQHSPITGIRRGVESIKACGADIIVSVGGGSPVDASKAMIFFLQGERGGEFLKQIAIPTTLSAAEYTIGAGYTDEQGNKASVNNQALSPAGVILDAELTLATPERLWLSTGIRALDHAVENLYRPHIPYPVKALCYAAITDLFTYLPKSKQEPDNVAFRQRLQLASWMSLWPSKIEKYSALGLSHALGHKLGATYSIGHGITSCLTLAAVVHLKASTLSQDDKEALAKALPCTGQTSTGTLEGDIHKLGDAIDDLVTKLGLKTTLTECKVPKEDAAKIAERALGGKEQESLPDVVRLVESLY